MSQEPAELLVTPKLFEQILRTEGNLIGLETANVTETLAQFRQLALRSGQSVYLWDPDGGIASLRESELRVPGSKRLTDALRYILQSMHFGIYLFTGFEDQLKPPNTSLLRRISRIQTGNERKVVFLADELMLPEELEGMLVRLNPRHDAGVRPRLRDGRWVT